MDKIAVLTLIMLLVISVGVHAYDLDVGFMQGITDSKLRLDISNFLFEVDGDQNAVNITPGFKLDTGFYDLYGVGKLNFAQQSFYTYEPDRFRVGLGYPIDFGKIKLRSEITAFNLSWYNWDDVQFVIRFGAQFNLYDLSGGK